MTCPLLFKISLILSGLASIPILSIVAAIILLGLITVLSTGVLTYFIYSAIRRKPDPMGMAIGTVGGNAVATPYIYHFLTPEELNVVVQEARSVGITTACQIMRYLR